LDKNFLITILAKAIEQSKGDLGRNEYLLKRIKENKEIINSDKLYLERISGLKITEITDKTDNQRQQIPEKDKSVSPILDLVKCSTCKKEIKMDEKSTRQKNLWYHETCYKTIPEKKPKKEKREMEKVQKSIILENVDSKTILQKEKPTIKKTIVEPHRQSLKVKHDPVLILLALTIFTFLFSASYLLIGSLSLAAMFLGGSLVMYQLLDAKKWGSKKFRTGRKIPSVFPLFLLFLPFGLAGMLAYEGYTAWESGYRAIILWGLTLVFWSTKNDIMSETWRQRLSRRRLEIGIEGPEYDYIQGYIEFYCSEADRRCKEIDMNKTVDEVIDSMKNEDFDRFTRSVIDSVHKKQGYDGQAPAQMA